MPRRSGGMRFYENVLEISDKLVNCRTNLIKNIRPVIDPNGVFDRFIILPSRDKMPNLNRYFWYHNHPSSKIIIFL
jgi:hypothetical protein